PVAPIVAEGDGPGRSEIRGHKWGRTVDHRVGGGGAKRDRTRSGGVQRPDPDVPIEAGDGRPIAARADDELEAKARLLQSPQFDRGRYRLAVQIPEPEPVIPARAQQPATVLAEAENHGGHQGIPRRLTREPG